MDDGVLIHHDKEFLKQALAKMKELVEEDGLEFNSKTFFENYFQFRRMS